jgi:predicted phage tail protein
MIKERQWIEGASGKSGGGGGSNATDTLVTDEKVLILHALGEGEINLFNDGVNFHGGGDCIVLNSVPLVNSDGSFNFGAYDQTTGDTGLYTGGGSTFWEFRNGSPSQTPMTVPAFPSASTVVPVNSEAFGGTSVPLVAPAPVIYSVSAANVDYALVDVEFPNGLQNVDTNGNIVGDSVQITIDVKPRTSGTWVNVIDVELNYKSSAAADIQYQVNNPNPGLLWDIRLSRITPDNSSATRSNQTFLKEVEEVQQITLSYDGIALVGLALDAATIGGTNASIPTMAFLVSKGPIQIPSNYNPVTNTFTGTWDGTFTTGVTDDPAWILYDMLTNPNYGAAIYGITPAMVDKFSFFNASVFNNVLVDDGKGMGTFEPRFTFNAPIQNRQDMYQTFQQVAGMFNACLAMVNGLVTCFQDRPTDPSYLITKANVIGSDATAPTYFKYSGSAVTDRISVVNVTYVNSLDPAWLPTTTSVQDATALALYGYQVYDLSAFGATTEGQAMRAGRYYMFTTLFNTETVDYDTGIEGFNSNLYDVISVFDDDYAGTAVGGRIISATANSVTLDQPVVITGTGSTVSVKLQDGVTYETHTITNAPGTYTTLNISGTWSVTPVQYCKYGVASGIQPRQFRIVDLRYDNVTKVVSVTAQLYNKNNYAYAESGFAIQPAVYTAFTQTAPLAPTNLLVTPSQYIDTTTNTVAYEQIISWDRPPSQNVSYQIRWRKDSGPYTATPQFTGNSYTLLHTLNGEYDYLVYSYNVAGNVSAPATISFTQDNSGGGTSATLSEITALSVQGGGTAWSGLDLNIVFTNPTANQGLLKDFVVTLKTTGGTLLRSVTVPGVEGGESQSFLYTYAMNNSDTGNAPVRSVVVKVQGQDSMNNTTTGATATLTNAAPAVPSGISASPGLQSAIISWTPETDIDVAGYIVWYSTTTGFTPSSANALDVGGSSVASIVSLVKSTSYFYRVAAYDVFGKSLTGSGMNLSSELSFMTPSSVGIASGSTLPTSGMVDGDSFYNTTNNTLYQFNGVSWVPVGIQSGSVLPTTNLHQGDVFFLTTDKKLYRYTGTAWTTAVDGADITADSIFANSIVSGSMTTLQFSANSISASILEVGSFKAAVGSFGTILANLIGATTVTATTLNIVSLSALTGNVGTLTAGILTNNSGTNIINLSATGSSNFIATPGFTITAAGTATFSGTLSGAIVAAPNIQAGAINTTALAAGAVTAAKASITTLDSLTANVGTLTAGSLTNNSGTNVINLSATGGSLFINTPGFTVTASGSMTINQVNVIGTLQIQANAVSTTQIFNQVTTFSFTAAANANTNVNNPNCSMTITLTQATLVQIFGIQTMGMNDGNGGGMVDAMYPYPGAFSTPLGDGASGLIKVDGTFHVAPGGMALVSLAAGSHTISMAGNFDTTGSTSADPSEMKGGQIIAQWAYR